MYSGLHSFSSFYEGTWVSKGEISSSSSLNIVKIFNDSSLLPVATAVKGELRGRDGEQTEL